MANGKHASEFTTVRIHRAGATWLRSLKPRVEMEKGHNPSMSDVIRWLAEKNPTPDSIDSLPERRGSDTHK